MRIEVAAGIEEAKFQLLARYSKRGDDMELLSRGSSNDTALQEFLDGLVHEACKLG
jgi:hypothetical protein